MVETHTVMANSNQPLGMTDSDPPFHETYKTLFSNSSIDIDIDRTNIEECELPLIDLSRLVRFDESEKERCKEDIARAANEWGFFQVINHGISRDILDKVREQQVNVFKQPFQNKCREDEIMNFSAGGYRWGTPTATCLRQLSWSEAFHIPMTGISIFGSLNTNFSSSLEQFATKVATLAQKLAKILAEKLGHNSTFLKQYCLPSTCYLRLNRYPPCPVPLYGIMPHTDSDFLTVLHQDHVGGLQLVKDGKWVSVKPNSDVLFINIGDLFQAWSNDCYKSVKHCVITNPTKERFSAAYFLCPSYETVIETSSEPSVYRRFSFKEYRQQVQEDVQNYGYKVGLPRFLA